MKKSIGLLSALIGLAFLFQYCAGSKTPAATSAAAVKPANAYTFEQHVMPLINSKCAPCHIPPDGKKKFYNTYASVKTDIDEMIRRVSLQPTEKGFMPFKKKEQLPDSLVQVFVKWKADGLWEK